jgi:hypothetical protein
VQNQPYSQVRTIDDESYRQLMAALPPP